MVIRNQSGLKGSGGLKPVTQGSLILTGIAELGLKSETGESAKTFLPTGHQTSSFVDRR